VIPEGIHRGSRAQCLGKEELAVRGGVSWSGLMGCRGVCVWWGVAVMKFMPQLCDLALFEPMGDAALKQVA